MSVDRQAATEAAMAEAYRAGPKDSLHKKRASRGQSFAAGFDAGVRWAATRDEGRVSDRHVISQRAVPDPSHRVEWSTSGMSARCLDCGWTYEYD